MKPGMKGLALVLGMKPKGKGSDSEEESGPASEPAMKSASDEYKSVFVDAAKAGDWEAAFDAVKQCCVGADEDEEE